MLADDVVVALLRTLSGRQLEERDRSALQRARDILAAVTQLEGREVATGSVFLTMAPLRAIEEAFETVNSASQTADLSHAIAGYIETLDGILNTGQQPPDTTGQLMDLFERIAEHTFTRSEEMVRPSRDERYEWIKKALTL